jgi:hypothetical protein
MLLVHILNKWKHVLSFKGLNLAEKSSLGLPKRMKSVWKNGKKESSQTINDYCNILLPVNSFMPPRFIRVHNEEPLREVNERQQFSLIQ